MELEWSKDYKLSATKPRGCWQVLTNWSYLATMAIYTLYLDLGRWKQDLHGARMDPRPEEAIAYSRIDLSLCCSISLHLKGTWETQNHHTRHFV